MVDVNDSVESIISAVLLLAAIAGGLWLSLPFTWAQPQADASCVQVLWMSTFPGIAALMILMWCCMLLAARNCHNADVGLLPALVCCVVLMGYLVCVSSSSMVFSHNCEGEDETFVYSMAAMVLGPLLVPPLFCVLGWCLWSCVLSWISASQAPRSPRIQRGQWLLREALLLGDASLVDLLLGFRQRRCCRGTWRLYRCVLLSLHCQWRCSKFCCADSDEESTSASDTEDATSSSSTSSSSSSSRSVAKARRASLLYYYEEEGQTGIHYLARGTRSVRGARRRRGCCWCCRRQYWPQVTDERRARLLRELVLSKHLPSSQLVERNVEGQVPLHCAASTGSEEVVQELLRLTESERDRELARTLLLVADFEGNSPCETALLFGHFRTARLLVGEQRSGLLRLPMHQQGLQDCVSGALARITLDSTMRAASPKPSVHEAAALLAHLEHQIQELRLACGFLPQTAGNLQLLPHEVAEALLKSHRFDVKAAAEAFRHSPREALAKAGLGRLAATEPAEPGGSGAAPGAGGFGGGGRKMCMVCFDEVDTSLSACRLLLCNHVTCDSCLAMHVKVRLEENDASGVVCCAPDCALPISEPVVRLILGGQDLERLRALKTRRFVDTSRGLAWCPAKNCGRAVQLDAVAAQVTVSCACGQRFCFGCQALEGHEPIPCASYADFLRDLQLAEQQMEDETRKWLADNSRTCSCGAHIQRNGGCNHMICAVCGRHFCYVCGQEWQLHTRQPGGFDFFECRLPHDPSLAGGITRSAPPVGGSVEDQKLWKMEVCLPGWKANERNSERHKLLLRALLLLAQEFSLGLDSASAWEALEASLRARRCLQHCYALKYLWSESAWQRCRLRHWVPELETAAGALEAAIGLSVLERELIKATVEAPGEPEDLLHLLDLRGCLCQLVAVSEALDALRTLRVAVSLQTARIIDAGRSGFEELGFLESVFEQVVSDLGSAAERRSCLLM
ncbi:unnamed protein product [Effrenium voratum]|nr:unnamed protein product [Effrenium voratum]